MQFNPQTLVKAVTLLVPTSLSATTTLNNSSPNLDVDTSGFAEALIIVQQSDAITATSDLLAIQFKETATAGSAYSDITGALLNVTGAATGQSGDNTTQVARIKLEGRKRYLSATLTETGTFVGTVSIIVVLIGSKDTAAYTAQTYGFNIV
jgi:hypothetical protein